LVEGTWVIVSFTDPDFQYPIILGSIAGIPQKNSNNIDDNETISERIQPLPPEPPGPVPIPEPGKIAKASSFRLSAHGRAEIESVEGLASARRDKTVLIPRTAPPSTIIYSYLDTSKNWTIGWG
jgi:hypothetical protein